VDHLNIIKLCVGAESVEDLLDWQKQNAPRWASGTAEHVTRMWPKRADEVLAGGSLYWVIKGVVLARQRIVGLAERRGSDGIARCALVLDAEVIRTKTTEMGEALAYGILDYFGIQTTTPSEEEDIMSTESTALLGTIADRLLVVSDALTTGKEGVKFDGDVIARLRAIESKLDALATTTEPERAEPEPETPAETAPVTGATAIREALATARAALSIIEANL